MGKPIGSCKFKASKQINDCCQVGKVVRRFTRGAVMVGEDVRGYPRGNVRVRERMQGCSAGCGACLRACARDSMWGCRMASMAQAQKDWGRVHS